MLATASEVLAGVIGGGFVSLCVAVYLEAAKAPRLVVDNPHTTPAGTLQWGNGQSSDACYLHVSVRNPGRRLFLRSWVIRSAAIRVTAKIWFFRSDGSLAFVRTPRVQDETTPMRGRWGSTPEPSRGVVFIRHDVEVFPDRSEALDVAVQLDRDTTAYGWSNSSYEGPRDVPWQLAPGVSLALVLVDAVHAAPAWGVFRVVNDGHRSRLGINHASASETCRVIAAAGSRLGLSLY
jgi:hypothetical protein